jgi:hypothetical protein
LQARFAAISRSYKVGFVHRVARVNAARQDKSAKRVERPQGDPEGECNE